VARRLKAGTDEIMIDQARKAMQKFTYNHLQENSFEVGLRTYAEYRDLGIAAATNGMARAHVIKLVPPFEREEVSKRHTHDVQFQFLYCLKGWMKGEYDGEEIVMREGSSWLQPPNIKHTVLGYSDDCELLEVIMPADFDTEEL
jgi:mannose-6-phosphate isomerase-like protein (cupin superfamily)